MSDKRTNALTETNRRYWKKELCKCIDAADMKRFRMLTEEIFTAYENAPKDEESLPVNEDVLDMSLSEYLATRCFDVLVCQRLPHGLATLYRKPEADLKVRDLVFLKRKDINRIFGVGDGSIVKLDEELKKDGLSYGMPYPFGYDYESMPLNLYLRHLDIGDAVVNAIRRGMDYRALGGEERIYRVADFLELDRKMILAWHRMGPTGYARVRQALKKDGLDFRDKN